MPSATIPIELLIGAGVAIAGAFGALWAKLRQTETKADTANDRYVAEVKANAKVLSRARFKLEQQRGISSEPPPSDDDWDETTERNVALSQEERRKIDKLLEEFVDSTPPRIPRPRKRQKSRPDR
jgi:hypothetical protein